MTEQPSNISSVKLGLAVAWPAFWTAVPVKIVFVLLLLAAELHPWEGVGLAFLLLLSIPVDIWALGVSARTVFLERLRLQPPDQLGLTLWWQSAPLNLLYLPLGYFIESSAIAGAKVVVEKIMEIELIKGMGVAERISIELVLWGSVATVVLLILALGWLYLFGWIVRKQVSAAPAADAPYPALVHQWDLMRVPADQPLLLTAFTAVGVVLVLLFWAVLPVMTPHPHEDYKEAKAGKVQPPIRPAETLQKTEKLIAQAETAVEALEAKAQAESKDPKEKDKGKGSANAPAPKVQPVSATKAEPAKGAKKDLGAGKTDSPEQGDDGHQH